MTELNANVSAAPYLTHWPPSQKSPEKKASFLMEDIVGSPYKYHFPSGGSTGSSPNTDSHSDRSTSPRLSENSLHSPHSEGSPVRPKSVLLAKKNRSSFTTEQTFQLERAFEVHPYINSKERQQLANALDMADSQVKTWFQNRRMKQKRKREEVTQKHAKLAYINNLSLGLTALQQPRLQPANLHGYQPPAYPGFHGCQQVPPYTGFPPERSPLHRLPQPPPYREFPGNLPEFSRAPMIYQELPGTGPQYSNPTSTPPNYPGLQMSQHTRDLSGLACAPMFRHPK